MTAGSAIGPAGPPRRGGPPRLRHRAIRRRRRTAVLWAWQERSSAHAALGANCAGIGVRLRRALPVGPRPVRQLSVGASRAVSSRPDQDPSALRALRCGSSLGPVVPRRRSWPLSRALRRTGRGNGAGHLFPSSSRFRFGFGTGSVPMTTSSRTSSRASATSSKQLAGVAGVGGRS